MAVLLLLATLAPAAPVVEVACLTPDGAKLDCAKLAQKLGIYLAGYSVTVTSADNGETADEAVFRVTVLDRPDAELGRACVVETIALLEKTAPPRTAIFACPEDSELERRLALHVKGELDGGFEEALRALRVGGSRRGRLVESPLARSLRPPPEPARRPETPESEPEPPAAEETGAPASRIAGDAKWDASLTIGGGVSGLGQLVAAALTLGVVFRLPVPVEVAVGGRLGLRPALTTTRGDLSALLIEPFVRGSYCFDLGRTSLCPGVTGELLLVRFQLSNFTQTFLITGAAGGDFIFRYVVKTAAPRIDLSLEGRLLGAFHRAELLSGTLTVFSAIPIVWGAEAGFRVFF